MSERRSSNSLFLLVGVVMGALGALVLSNKESQRKISKAFKEGSQTGGQLLEELSGRVSEKLSELAALHRQNIDKMPVKKNPTKTIKKTIKK